MKITYLQAHVGKKLPDTNLTILEDLGTKFIHNKMQRFFKVQCDCGTIKECVGASLSKTCGGCQISKDRRTAAQKVGSKAANIKKYKKAILLENKKYGFVMLKTTYNEFKKRGEKIGWNITPQDIEELWIKQGGRCRGTGMPLTCGTNLTNRTWSLDRIDSDKPYTKDNIQLVSKVYNMIKRTCMDEQIRLFSYLVSQNTPIEETRKYNNMTQAEINIMLKDCTKVNK